MYLLHTKTLKLRHVITCDSVPYAILSHTWGDEEVSFQDIQIPRCNQLKGFAKIEQCCNKAASDGYDYVWVDTCCIDKASSAELSEAINSMYNWYYNAGVCFVYLGDLDSSINTDDNYRALLQCRWFRRGWTLQELLAPSTVRFYNRNWSLIGDKSLLAGLISRATGIESRYIKDRSQIRKASVAARMSWAAHRATTRPEDEAYSLMGLFDVNMPLLYGEGRKAFRRLQYEIAQSTDDESLFAWYSVAPQSGIFAPSTKAFAMSGDIVQIFELKMERAPYSVTNRGLCFEAIYKEVPPEFMQLLPASTKKYRIKDYILVPLNCTHRKSNGKPFTIILKQLTDRTIVRSFPGEDKAYEKYFRARVDQHRRIVYITEPPYEIPISRVQIHHEGLASTVSVLPPSNFWYITPPGHVKSFVISPDMLMFGSRAAFAVLTVENPILRGPVTIVLRQTAATPLGGASVVLHIVDNQLPVAEVVDNCHSQMDLTNGLTKDEKVQRCRSTDGYEVLLSKEDSYPDRASHYALDVVASPNSSGGYQDSQISHEYGSDPKSTPFALRDLAMTSRRASSITSGETML
ncbi:MAG: hypothetical protein Q9218_005786 [Villophora microphyllina]